MRVRIKKYTGVFANAEGGLVNPAVGSEVNVSKEMGQALIDADSAEEVKAKRGGRAKTGPAETREPGGKDAPPSPPDTVAPPASPDETRG